MNMADKLGLGPLREVTELPDGKFQVKITPPAWSGFKNGSTLTLTPGQYERYQQWLGGNVLIQDAFPEFTAGQREALISGIPEVDFDKFAEEEDSR